MRQENEISKFHRFREILENLVRGKLRYIKADQILNPGREGGWPERK